MPFRQSSNAKLYVCLILSFPTISKKGHGGNLSNLAPLRLI